MEIYAKAELIIDTNILEDSFESFDYEENIDLEEILLGVIELDKKIVVNIREKAAMLMEIIDHTSEIYYDHPPRTRHEINGGYKLAKRKGARLEEVKVYNLYFRFKSRYNGTGLALMCRPEHVNEEWIILLPDDTKKTIAAERKFYLDIARSYTLIEQIMNPNEQNRLIQNLDLLNIHERCAQTLLHEYGHVLHWRVFDDLHIHKASDIYTWFYETGYLKNVIKRYPYLEKNEPLDQITLLKESLVEDYRISLNLESGNDIFILPNKVCFSGDFQIPELMLEGVEIMKQMIRRTESYSKRRNIYNREMDSIYIGRQIEAIRRHTKWIPGSTSITEKEILNNIKKLRMIEDVKTEVAVTN